jgi:hypothetical protein
MATYTQAQLDAIRRAYASGVTEITVDGNRTTYRSLAEMRQIIADIEAGLPGATARQPTHGVATFGRE